VEGRLFTLVDAAEYDDIFAWGMEITHPDGRAAVIYRWDPTTRQSTQGVHSSAAGARVLYSRLAGVSLTLAWMDLREGASHLPALTS
jgi:hypothetical protein